MADDITLGGEQLAPQDQAALDRVRGVTNDDTNPYNEDGSLKNEPFEIPEKFKGKSPEEIVKSYLELEKKLSEKQPNNPEKAPDAQQDAIEAKVESALTPKDFEVYEKAYLENGSHGYAANLARKEQGGNQSGAGESRGFASGLAEHAQYGRT